MSEPTAADLITDVLGRVAEAGHYAGGELDSQTLEGFLAEVFALVKMAAAELLRDTIGAVRALDPAAKIALACASACVPVPGGDN